MGPWRWVACSLPTVLGLDIGTVLGIDERGEALFDGLISGLAENKEPADHQLRELQAENARLRDSLRGYQIASYDDPANYVTEEPRTLDPATSAYYAAARIEPASTGSDWGKCACAFKVQGEPGERESVSNRYFKNRDFLLVLDGVEVDAAAGKAGFVSTSCVPASSMPDRAKVQLTVVAPLNVQRGKDTNFCHNTWQVLLPFANDMHLLRRQHFQDANLVFTYEGNAETDLAKEMQKTPAFKFIPPMFRNVFFGWDSFVKNHTSPVVHQLAVHPYRLPETQSWRKMTVVPKLFGQSEFTFASLPFTAIAASAFASNIAQGLGLQRVVPSLAGLFLSRCGRGVTGRRFLNGNAVRGLFEDRGFELQQFDPGGLTVLQTVGMLRQAKFIVGMHGAGLTNLVFMHSSTVVLEVFPHNFVDGMYRSLAGWKHINYLFY